VERHRARGEKGETLAEIIVTIAIVGLAVVALLGALATGISASSTHRQRASADTVARSVAEAIKDRTVPLDAAGNYPSAIWTSTVDTSGFTPSVPAAKCLSTFSSSMTTLDATNFTATCTANSPALQLVTVTVTATGGKGESETVSIMKRKT
jgi:type II secretory pathway pseudopilin PulG